MNPDDPARPSIMEQPPNANRSWRPAASPDQPTPARTLLVSQVPHFPHFYPILPNFPLLFDRPETTFGANFTLPLNIGISQNNQT
jgi:hypothetical protein